MKSHNNTKKISLILTGKWSTLTKNASKNHCYSFPPNFISACKTIAFIAMLFFSSLYADCYQNPAMLSLGVGTFDTSRPNRRMLQFQMEYKWSASWKGVQPFACAMATQKGSLYFCFGGCYDFFSKKHLVLTLAFAPGIYFKNHGKDLGFPLEFRSSIALAFQFPNKDRLGIQFYHISNASLGHKNPGEESLVLFYGISL